ncbi:mitochondrial transcription termination factor family protein [Actinidia rufa]|uniref:Mitochondrial transcription termination factor family protein n=1 Tax=Actinidia rufa TaxID=165716 RepID=A0A7J0E9U3_9ERIC|nr:mitochondrial transcription termination factor family protein [Actinidia rufa]
MEGFAVDILEEDLNLAGMIEHLVVLGDVRVVDIAEDLDFGVDLEADRVLVMQSLTAIRSSDLFSLSGAAFSLPRICFATIATESVNEGSFSLRVVPPNLLAAEREEAKAVLTLFLKKQGRELTTLEIRDALIPYLETLLEEFGDILVDLVENFPNPPIKERSIEKLLSPPEEGRPVVPVSTPNTAVNSKRIKAVDRVTKVGPAGKLPPHVVYLTELGMELELIKEMTRKFPSFAYYTAWRGKLSLSLNSFSISGYRNQISPPSSAKGPNSAASASPIT